MKRKTDKAQSGDKRDPQRLAEARGKGGCFMPDGSWWKDGEWNDLTRFVNELVKLRRRTAMSPEEIAIRIAHSKFTAAFSPATILHWTSLPSACDWPKAWTSRSAEDAIKHCGYGSLMRWHDDGWCECTCPEMFTLTLPAKPLDWPSPVIA